MNHNLRFPDEQVAIEAMPQYRANDRWIVSSQTHALDPIGMLTAPTGQFVTIDGDIDGQTTELSAPIPGWHCNLMVDTLSEELKQYEVFPAIPLRVWA